jgi:hypothetical protein
MIIRLIGVGVKEYYLDKFNFLDVILVCISVIDMVISFTSNKKNTILLTGFRAVRILRIIKLARKWVSFRLLLSQVIASLKEIFTFMLLMSIFICIFMVLGFQFFANTVYFDLEGEIVTNEKDGSSPE